MASSENPYALYRDLVSILVVLLTVSFALQILLVKEFFKQRRTLGVMRQKLLGWENVRIGTKLHDLELSRRAQILRTAHKLEEAKSTAEREVALEELKLLISLVEREAPRVKEQSKDDRE